MRTITARATRGASIRCTTTRIRPSDALEKITHSLCTLEFEDHRPLYDWLIDNLPVPAKPQQIEFARLNLTYTVMSKRKLLELVQESAWPAGTTRGCRRIVGMRRRGYTPAAIRAFCDRIGVAKRENIVGCRRPRACGARGPQSARSPCDGCARPAPRRDRELPGVRRARRSKSANNPEDAVRGQSRPCRSRACCGSSSDDFREDPPKKFFRLSPGREVRLRGA